MAMYLRITNSYLKKKKEKKKGREKEKKKAPAGSTHVACDTCTESPQLWETQGGKQAAIILLFSNHKFSYHTALWGR